MSLYERFKQHEGHELAVSLHDHERTTPGISGYFDVAEIYCVDCGLNDSDESSLIEVDEEGKVL